MAHDTYRTTKELRAVCDRVEELRRNGLLEGKQGWLARILRDSSDWRQRHAVLEAVAEIRNPCDDLVREICRVVSNQKCECGTRLLACDAAECLLRRGGTLGSIHDSAQIVFQEARRMLRATQPPPRLLRQAIAGLLELEPAASRNLSARGADGP